MSYQVLNKLIDEEINMSQEADLYQVFRYAIEEGVLTADSASALLADVMSVLEWDVDIDYEEDNWQELERNYIFDRLTGDSDGR